MGQDVRAGREKLAELYERRTEIVQSPAQPNPKVGAHDLLQGLLPGPGAPDVEYEPKPVPDEDPADLGEPGQISRATCGQRICILCHAGARADLDSRRILRLIFSGQRLGLNVTGGLRRVGRLRFEHPHPMF